MATQTALVLANGAFSRLPDADTLAVGTGIVSTNSQDLILDASGSNVSIAAGINFTALAGAGAFDFSNATGTFNTPTGAVTIGPGTTTMSGTTTFTAAGTALTVNNDVSIGGNLTVTGDVVQQDVTNSNFSDNMIYLNNGYETVAAKTGGLVTNYLPTATNDTVAVGGFTAGVAATSNPTVATSGAATFAAGDIIQIGAAANATNNGLFEVESHAANLLTIRGIGTSATVEEFSQNQFATDTTVAGTIRKVTVGVLRIGTDGVPETGSGSVTGISYTDLATASGVTLQTAYETGNTITTSGVEGDFTVNGTEDLVLGGSADLNWTSSGDLLVVDNTAEAFAIKEGATSYLTVTTTDASEAVSVGNATTNPTITLLGNGQKTVNGNLDATGGLDVTGGDLTHSGGNVALTGVNIDLDPTGTFTLDMDTGNAATVTVADNLADAFLVQEGVNAYIDVTTTTASEAINLGNATTNPSISLLGTGQKTVNGNLDATGGLDVTGGAFTHTGGAFTLTSTNIDLDPTGSFALDMDTGNAATITLADNLADAFLIQEGANAYLDITTTNGSEKIELGNATTNPAFEFLGTGTTTLGGSLITPGSVRFGETTDPTAVADTGFVYTKDDGGDTELFYRDAGGNIVQITLDGALNVGSTNATITATADEAITAGMLVAFDGGGVNGEAFKADMSVDGEKANTVGIALSTVSAAGSFETQTSGESAAIPDALWDAAPGAADIGKVVYGSITTAGELTITPPATGVRQKVGVITFADGTADTTRIAIQIGEKVVL